MRIHRIAGVVAPALVLMMGTSAFAQYPPNNDWTNGSGNSLWSNAANWTLGIPTSDQALRISSILIPPETIVLPDNAIANSVSVSSPISFVGGTLATGSLAGEPFYNAAFLSNLIPLPGTSTVRVLGLNFRGTITGPTDVTFTNSAKVQSALTYTGTTTIGGYLGGATLSDAGAIVASSTINLIDRLTLQCSQGSSDRIADSIPINLQNSGGLLLSNSGAAVTEKLGTVTFSGFRSFISINPDTGSGLMNVSIDSLNRQENAIGSISFGTNSSLVARNAPDQIGGAGAVGTTTRSIIPWLHASSGSTALPVFLNGDNGVIRPLAADEFATTLANAPETANVRLTTPQTLTGDTTVNSLILNDAAVTLTNHKTLTVSSGAVLLGLNTASTGTGIIGISGDGILYAPDDLAISASLVSSRSDFLIDVPIKADSLTVNTEGLVQLRFGKYNAVSGPTTILGNVASLADGALGDGLLKANDAYISVANVSQRLGGSQGVVLSGRSTLNVGSGIRATIAGPLEATYLQNSGAGTLVIAADSPNITAPAIYVYGPLEIDGIFGGASPIYLLNRSVVTGKAANIFGTIAGGDIEPGVPVGTMSLLGVSSSGEDGTPRIGFDIAGHGVAGIDFDQLIVRDQASFGSYHLDVRLLNGFVPTFGEAFEIVQNLSNTSTSPFANQPEGSYLSVNGTPFRVTYLGGVGNNDVILTVVPEPSLGYVMAELVAATNSRPRKRFIVLSRRVITSS